MLPIVHWLPKPWFRYILSVSGYGFFASEENLNLMSISEVYRAASLALPSSDYRFKISTVNLLGLGSNILLYGERVNEKGLSIDEPQ